MRRCRTAVLGFLTAAALAAPAPTALAQSPANSPAPEPGEPSCGGLIIAAFNHESGVAGPSGNPMSSVGPGPNFRPDTHWAIENLARPNCTP
jgi:hypothetical protein